LLWLTTVTDYTVGRLLGVTAELRRRRALITTSVVVQLGILGFFKYAGFFSESLQGLLGRFGIALPRLALDVVLPVGVSFYTFQSLSYTIDVYRGRIGPARNFLDFALYTAFFPQLVAGPIERAGHLLPQIFERRTLTGEAIGTGAWLVLWGLFKKVVIADNLASLVDAVYDPASHPTGVEVLLASYAFAVQIYCDFSGYTDVARGTARLLGFDLLLNFNLPYFATSPADFWRRWHISLSSWLRDYLYIPLGGNRGSAWATYRNLGITMLLGGLWHGAAWTYVIWGAYHGALLMVHRALRPLLAAITPRSPWGHTLWTATSIAVTFHLVCLGWVVFRAHSLPDLLRLLETLVGSHATGLARAWLVPLALLIAPLALIQLAQAISRNLMVVLRWPFAARVATYAALALAIVLVGEDFGAPFIYFQF